VNALSLPIPCTDKYIELLFKGRVPGKTAEAIKELQKVLELDP
jgi:hypothetical protein